MTRQNDVPETNNNTVTVPSGQLTEAQQRRINLLNSIPPLDFSRITTFSRVNTQPNHNNNQDEHQNGR